MGLILRVILKVKSNRNGCNQFVVLILLSWSTVDQTYVLLFLLIKCSSFEHNWYKRKLQRIISYKGHRILNNLRKLIHTFEFWTAGLHHSLLQLEGPS